MSIRTRCPLGSTARAVLVVPSFRPPPFFSPRKNHHHLYYPFFPLSSPLVVSHLITPRRKPLRHLSMRPARRRRSSTRVSFPVARTSDFFDRCFPTSPFFPKKEESTIALSRVAETTRKKTEKKNTRRGFSRLVFSPSFILTTRVVVLLSLSLSLSLFALQREEKKRKNSSFFWRDYSLVLFEKNSLSLFCGCGARSPRARKPHQTKRSQKERKNIFFFCFFSLFFFVAWWCKRIELMTFEVRCCFLSRDTRKRYFLTHHKKKHTHHERSTHTDESDDSDEFERGSFSSRSRSRSGTKEAETPTRGNIMPL